uniref:Uncharacterized protein n=1 Tax=Amphimedon queenslandica TaxID=400682 RepID=A0A1X7V4S5_AMPQE
MSESVPLLRPSVTSRRKCFPSSYRFQFIHSKGALLVLFWDLMISLAQNSIVDILNFSVTLKNFYFFVALGVIVRVNLLPYNIDQLIGSSSGELTAIIHWHNIGPVIANAIADGAYLFHITKNNMIIFMLVASSVCIGVVLVSHSLFNHYLDTTSVNTVNPVKLIVRVLCYARKHKYPENRSALTYWEEEAPSRLDLGKDKYGGPFTEEEVEDVKTVLRLIPLVIVCTVASGLCYEYTQGLKLEFLIYPCFHNYIPSMLKRIGMGLVLIVLINILYTGLAVIVIWYITYIVLVEFILAQCPKSMRGTMVGLWFCIWAIKGFIEYPLFLPFLHYMNPKVPLGRGFYYLFTRTIFALLCFIIFLLLAKRYKLRVREVQINIHQIAENHTINNIEQEEEYWRRNAIESSSQLTDVIIIEY